MTSEQIKNLVKYAATLVVFIAGLFGVAISEETASIVVYAVALVALVAWGLWKNHNLTTAAILGQKVLDALKKEVVTPESVEELLRAAQDERGAHEI